jgi:hypothetical protein
MVNGRCHNSIVIFSVVQPFGNEIADNGVIEMHHSKLEKKFMQMKKGREIFFVVFFCKYN